MCGSQIYFPLENNSQIVMGENGKTRLIERICFTENFESVLWCSRQHLEKEQAQQDIQVNNTGELNMSGLNSTEILL